jgi:hypothetical protein
MGTKMLSSYSSTPTDLSLFTLTFFQTSLVSISQGYVSVVPLFLPLQTFIVMAETVVINFIVVAEELAVIITCPFNALFQRRNVLA